MTRRIFVDMDGVGFHFEEHFETLFGKDCTVLEDDPMWDHINNYEGEFFFELPLMEGFVESVNQFRYDFGVDPIFLTACPKHAYATAARQKTRAIRKAFPNRDYLVLPVLGGVNKALFIQNEGDVLIDDFTKNIDSWKAAGGRGILFKDWISTYMELLGIFKHGKF